MPDAVVAAYSKEAGASYFNTSAKTGSGLEQAFLDIAKRVMEKQHEKAARSSGTGSLGISLISSLLLPMLRIRKCLPQSDVHSSRAFSQESVFEPSHGSLNWYCRICKVYAAAKKEDIVCD